MKSDPVKLVMVLRNLIGNAIKFSERGRVQVAVDQRATRCGSSSPTPGSASTRASCRPLPALPPGPRRALAPRRRAGLGLYIVGRLVELSTAASPSTAARAWATFTMTVPCGTAAAAKAAGGDGWSGQVAAVKLQFADQWTHSD
jgi:light-regulated signal transduction histidine kinase (bacteriophytochrome)